MTNPDAPSPHDVSPTFKWSSKYDDQLRYIADTDELPDAEDTYQWSELKDAIKFKIRQAVDAFDENPSPILHPAARMGTVSTSASASSMSSDGAGLGITNLGPSQQQAAQGLENRFASTSNTNGHPSSTPTPTNGGASSSSSSESDEDVSMSFEDKEDDEDENDSEDDDGALPSSSPDYDGAGGPTSGMQQGAQDSSLISEANRSGFFPAKTKAPAERKGNWGRVLSKTETQHEMHDIFSMLDDFDVSPPFTIQRLSELLLSPKQFVRSAPKFLSSLMRLLSVTASHADFPPVSPGQPPIGAMASTAANGGGVSVRSVGPPSPSTEPLFSPIPFLQRPGGHSSDDGETEEGGVRDDAVPALDLNQGESANSAQQTATAASASIPLPAVSSSTSTSSGSLGSNATSQPLGVPPGQIDELEEESAASGGDSTTDQSAGTSTASAASSAHHMDGAVHPLSSTTTTTKTAAAATTTSTSSEQEDDHERGDDDATSHKRLRSQSPMRGQQGTEGEGEGSQSGIERAGKEAEQLDQQQS